MATPPCPLPGEVGVCPPTHPPDIGERISSPLVVNTTPTHYTHVSTHSPLPAGANATLSGAWHPQSCRESPCEKYKFNIPCAEERNRRIQIDYKLQTGKRTAKKTTSFPSMQTGRGRVTDIKGRLGHSVRHTGRIQSCPCPRKIQTLPEYHRREQSKIGLEQPRIWPILVPFSVLTSHENSPTGVQKTSFSPNNRLFGRSSSAGCKSARLPEKCTTTDRFPGRVGIPTSQEKVQPNSHTNTHLSRFPLEPKRSNILSHRCQGQHDHSQPQQNDKEKNLAHSRHSVHFGNPPVHCTSSTCIQITNESTANILTPVHTARATTAETRSQHGGKRGLDMVARRVEAGYFENTYAEIRTVLPQRGDPLSCLRERRVRRRMGRAESDDESEIIWEVRPPDVVRPDRAQGATSSSVWSTNVVRHGTPPLNHTPEGGFHSSTFIPPQNERREKTPPLHPTHTTPHTVEEKRCESPCGVCPLSGQCGRCGHQTANRSPRLPIQQGPYTPPHSTTEDSVPITGLLCQPEQPGMQTVLFPLHSASDVEAGCTQSGGIGSAMLSPAFHHLGKSSMENTTTSGTLMDEIATRVGTAGTPAEPFIANTLLQNEELGHRTKIRMQSRGNHSTFSQHVHRLLGESHASSGMESCVVSFIAAGYTHKGLKHEAADTLAFRSIGNQAHNFGATLGRLIEKLEEARGLQFENVQQFFEYSPSPETLTEAIIGIKDDTNSCQIIKKLQTLCSHLANLKAVLKLEACSALHTFLQKESKLAKAPKYDDFWEVEVFLTNIKPEFQSYLEQYKSAAAESPPVYNVKLFCRLRKSSVILLRLALVGRNVDAHRIKRWRLGSRTNLETILYLLTRRKMQAKYEWEPVLPASEAHICPITHFLAYLDVGSWSHNWNHKPTTNPVDGTEYSVWRSSTGDHHGIQEDTLANDALDMLEKGGVDTAAFTADSVRGAAASAGVAMGCTAAQVMSRGHWTQSAVFQTYYNRGGRYINWMEVFKGSHQKEKDTPTTDSGLEKFVQEVEELPVLQKVLGMQRNLLEMIPRPPPPSPQHHIPQFLPANTTTTSQCHSSTTCSTTESSLSSDSTTTSTSTSTSSESSDSSDSDIKGLQLKTYFEAGMNYQKKLLAEQQKEAAKKLTVVKKKKKIPKKKPVSLPGKSPGRIPPRSRYVRGQKFITGSTVKRELSAPFPVGRVPFKAPRSEPDLHGSGTGRL